MPAPLRVSVVLPTYNSATFVARAIASVQQQTLQDFEIIVVDDGSTDDTVSVLKKRAEKDSRIRLFPQPVNKGPSFARNIGFANAQGDWIAILDADDAYKPERLERLIAQAEVKNLDMIADNFSCVDALAGTGTGKILFNTTGKLLPVCLKDYLKTSNFKLSLGQILGKDPVQLSLSQFIFSRAFLTKQAIAYPEFLRYGEDFYMYAECLLHGAKAAIVPDASYIYTQQIGKISNKKSPHSRTQASREQALLSAETFERNYASRLSPDERRQLRIRQKALTSLYAYRDARQALRDRNLLQTAKILFKNPTSWRFTLREIFIFLRNMSRRIAPPLRG